jgi:DNA-binding NtrC family response regulator
VLKPFDLPDLLALVAKALACGQDPAGLLNQARQGKIDNAHARLIAASERELFAQAIQLAQGNQVKAAQWTGVSRTTLRDKLRHFGLHPAASGPSTEPENETTV